MAEEKATGVVAGWIKAAITSLMGLVGGAILMYITPLVNLAIKPSKPLANFAMQVQGNTVTFNNRSQGGSQGWWDFGDGSALEPYSEKQDTITHTYPRTGTYTIKLSLQNLVGEESDRTITVEVDPVKNAVANAVDTKVAIDEFVVEPVSQPGMIPATYAIRAKIKNAERCIWDSGEKRPLKFVETPGDAVQHWVTFREPGRYFVRLAVMKGKDIVEKDQLVQIDEPSAINKTSSVGFLTPPTAFSDAMATLKVTYEAVQVTQQTKAMNIPVRWNASEHENSSPFAVTQMLDNHWKDFRIVGAELSTPPDGHVRNPQLEFSRDGKKLTLRGELVRSSGWLASKLPPPNWTATVTLKLERSSAPTVISMDEIPIRMTIPGDTILPIPPLDNHLQMTKKVMHLEMSDGTTRVWSQDGLPTNVVVQMHNHPMRVSAAEQPGRLVIRVSDANARQVSK